MKAGRLHAFALLLLLLASQVLDSVHGISHVASADDQVCSQCLHARPKQHAILPSLPIALSGPGAVEPSHTGVEFPSTTSRLTPRPRGPPTAG